MTYVFTANYKADLHSHISNLFTQDKTVGLTREQRLTSADELVEAYVEHTGKRPDGTPLERLATLLLREELTDDTPWKTQNTEHPFESEHKAKRYYDKLAGEVPESLGTDGVDYRLPLRKHRTAADLAYMDKQAGRLSVNAIGKKTT